MEHRRADPCSTGRDGLPGTRATVASPPSALPRPPQGPPRRTAPSPGWGPRQGLLASEVWPSLRSSKLAFHGSKRNSTQVYTKRRTDPDNEVLGLSGFSHCCLLASAARFSALPLWKGCPPYHKVTYFQRKTHYPRGRRTLSLPPTAYWYGWPLSNTRLRGASFSTVANARIACSGPSVSAVSHPQSEPATGCVVLYHLLLKNSPV